MGPEVADESVDFGDLGREGDAGADDIGAGEGNETPYLKVLAPRLEGVLEVLLAVGPGPVLWSLVEGLVAW